MNISNNSFKIATAYRDASYVYKKQEAEKKTKDKESKVTEQKADYGKTEESSKKVSKEDALKNAKFGKTVGNVKLSEKAEKYYEHLRKKFYNYEFILVSNEEKEKVKANTSKYANGIKPVVLISEDTVEKMTSDEKYRKKYEGILSGAEKQLKQLKNSLESSGAEVNGYGIQVNDAGLTSFFAVLKKSSADQKARIEKNAEKKKAAKKEAEKAAEKKAEKEISADKTKKTDTAENKAEKENNKMKEEYETFTFYGNSVEELMNKVNEHIFSERSSFVQTEEEKKVGVHIDFRG